MLGLVDFHYSGRRDILDGKCRLRCGMVSSHACRKPGPLVPVRVRRRIVAIRARQAAIAAVVQIAKAPGHPDAGRVVEIESRHVTKSCFSAAGSRCEESELKTAFDQGPAAPLAGGITPPAIHPAFSQIRKAAGARSSPRSTA